MFHDFKNKELKKKEFWKETRLTSCEFFENVQMINVFQMGKMHGCTIFYVKLYYVYIAVYLNTSLYTSDL